MDLGQVLILSIVEGLTEFLPISSTGHLVLTSKLLHIPQTEFVKTFEIFIQMGAILAVVVLYWKTLSTSTRTWFKIITAFIPTAILGLIFYQFIKTYLLGNLQVTLIALFLGGLALILIEKVFHHPQKDDSLDNLTFRSAFLIGLIQSISMFPGVSRAAVTILGGMFLGLSRKTAAEFSFLLAIPTIISAAGLDLSNTGLTFSSNEYLLLLVGLVGAFFSALVCIKFFIKFLQNHTFVSFGIYRIILAAVFWLLFITNLN